MTNYQKFCDDCGKFMDCTDSGTSTANIYDFAAMECIYDHWRCPSCTARLGPIRSFERLLCGCR